MEGTRLGILTLLQRKPATVDQLSTELGLASGAVRRHLEILQRDRLVAYEPVRRKPGRPEHLFALTEAGHAVMPKRYPRLLQRMLHTLERSTEAGDGAAESLLLQVAQTIVEEHVEGEPVNEDRIDLLRRILEEEQFAPTVEESDGEVNITLHNCPYRDVAHQSYVICNLDRNLIANVLNGPVTNTSRINLGNKLCTYSAPAPKS